MVGKDTSAYICGHTSSGNECPLRVSLLLQVAPVEASVDKEWNRICLTVAQDGTIVSHTGKLALFGLEKEVGNAAHNACNKDPWLVVADNRLPLHAWKNDAAVLG